MISRGLHFTSTWICRCGWTITEHSRHAAIACHNGKPRWHPLSTSQAVLCSSVTCMQSLMIYPKYREFLLKTDIQTDADKIWHTIRRVGLAHNNYGHLLSLCIWQWASRHIHDSQTSQPAQRVEKAVNGKSNMLHCFKINKSNRDLHLVMSKENCCYGNGHHTS